MLLWCLHQVPSLGLGLPLLGDDGFKCDSDSFLASSFGVTGYRSYSLNLGEYYRAYKEGY